MPPTRALFAGHALCEPISALYRRRTWTVLNSGAIAYYASRIYLINPPVSTEHGDIAAGSLGLVLGRTIGEALHEDIDIRNYSSKRVRFNLEILIRNDFADIFEVKSKALTRRGHIETEWAVDRQRLTSRYVHGDFHRALMISLEGCDSKALYGNGRINFALDLAPGAAWHACCKYHIKEGDILRRAPTNVRMPVKIPAQLKAWRSWKQVTTQITTSNEEFYRLYRQSVEDMAALRLTADEAHPKELLAAAGVPWFVSVFGRDSLIVSLQNMMVYPDFARGTLKRLADLQATEMDDLSGRRAGQDAA